MLGGVAALVLPIGPVTTVQATALVVVCALVGVLVGRRTATRWSAVALPLGYVAGFELLGAHDLATSAAPRLDSTWGILILLAGRGFHALVRRERARAPDAARFRSAPALEREDRSHGARGDADERTDREWRHAVQIRGASKDAPVLLSLAGGPGQSDLALSRTFLADLEEDLVVVSWDMRGIGKSYPAVRQDVTTERVVKDTIEVTNYVRTRFDEERIYLLGESGGTVIGVLAVQQRPELFHAWLGSGQMVNPTETDRRIRADLRAWARREGRDDVVEQLEEFGDPPYDSVIANAYVAGYYDRLEPDLEVPEYAQRRQEDAGVGFMGLGGSEYALVDKVNAVRGRIDVFGELYPQWRDLDFRQSVPRLEVPVHVFSGDHELEGRRDLAHEWFAGLRAPSKELHRFPNGGHAPVFENFREFHRVLVDEIVPATYERP